MCRSTLLRVRSGTAERPGKYGLEAVVDCARSLGDGPRTIGPAAREDRYGDAASVRQRDEADVIGQAVERSGLVLDRRPKRQHRLHPVLPRLALGHEVEEIVAALGLDQLGLIDAAKQVDHRHRRARIASIPQVALRAEQLRNGAVNAKAGDAIVLEPIVDGARAAKIPEKDIRRAIVAV